MNNIEVKAYAKLNLSLDVLGKLPNGYHEMKTVMQTASLYDEIRISLNDSGEVSAYTNFGYLPKDGRNIAVKAAQVFFKTTGIQNTGAELYLKKRIPVGAGLGGGSADAAAVLRGLNKLTNAGLSFNELEAISETLGSDVPFCVRGGTKLAVGRGEQLLHAPEMPKCGIVICKPSFSIRTPDLFAKIDARRSKIHPDTEGLISAMATKDTEGMAHRMYNVFEDVLPRNCGEIGTIKHLLLDVGALGAVMSGTGSAVFGIFSDYKAAESATVILKHSYRECFAVVPINEIKE